MPLAVGSTVTTRIKLGTAIALAFPRSPTLLAHTAWDLQASSGGRFMLGLGTQVKGHNERRFGVKWEAPAKKLREVILAIRAIWDCWQNGTRLDFQGEFYRLNLMTPFFSPPPIEHPDIPIFIASVNRHVTRLAGELANGFHIHPMHSVKFVKESILPDLAEGARRAGRSHDDIELSTSAFVAIGETQAEIDTMREEIRRQISFYASTRTYLPVLDAHGWGEVGRRLNTLAARGAWREMAAEITDEMLEAFSISGTPDEIPALLRARYEGLLDRVSFYFADKPGQNTARWTRIVRALGAMGTLGAMVARWGHNTNFAPPV
jgi:probable F420-dependent oxidoreductase